MRFRRKRPIKEMLVVESDTTILNADKSVEERLRQIIRNEANKIGDVIWSNRPSEPVVVLMFLTENRIRVGDIYIVSHDHFKTLLNFLTIRETTQAPQSI